MAEIKRFSLGDQGWDEWVERKGAMSEFLLDQGLSTKTVNALARSSNPEINLLDPSVLAGMSDKELQDVWNLGEKGIKQIRELLAKRPELIEGGEEGFTRGVFE